MGSSSGPGRDGGRSLAERLPLEAAGVERTEQRPSGRRTRARERSAIRSLSTACRDRLLAQLDTRAGPRSPSAAWPARTARSSARPASAPASASGPTSTATTSDRGAELGLLLHRRLRQGRRRQLPAATRGPLPAVADPQVRDMVGPVRHVRLRRLRPLHHLVPGRHRRPRGARGHRRAPPPARWPLSASPRRGRSRRGAFADPALGSRASRRSDRRRPTRPRCASWTIDPLIARRPARPVRDGHPAWPACRCRSRSRASTRDGRRATIRAAGPATASPRRLGVGDELGLRGPLGRAGRSKPPRAVTS